MADRQIAGGGKDTMRDSKYFRDRRKYPRVFMDLPLEYIVRQATHARGGLVVDASETGLLIYSREEIPIGTRLKIGVLFPKKFELANFEVLAEIVWKKDDFAREKKGFQYGVKFLQILEEDHEKLRQLLIGRYK
jgi:c-di-GMP-binding flagellar brake protein YcgR